MTKLKYPKNVAKKNVVDNEIDKQNRALLRSTIDAEVAAIEEKLDGATGSKYTAFVFAQKKLLQLRSKF